MKILKKRLGSKSPQIQLLALFVSSPQILPLLLLGLFSLLIICKFAIILLYEGSRDSEQKLW